MSKNWYILHTYTGYEGKIERTIRSLLEKNEIDPEVVLDVKVPVEELVEIKDGKKRTRSNKFLPGYIMLEMDLPEIGWKDTCAKLYKIQGVTGFVGNVSRNNRPLPITADEAKNLFLKMCEDNIITPWRIRVYKNGVCYDYDGEWIKYDKDAGWIKCKSPYTK